MSKRTAFWLAWLTWLLYLVIAVVTLRLQLQDGQSPSAWLSDLFGALILLAFATVGALIASLRPDNRIGWLFCVSALLWALGDFLLEYTTYALITVPGSLPAAALLGTVGDWMRGLGFFLILTFLLLLFPTGHLPSPRWRFLAWFILSLMAAYSLTLLLSPYPYVNVDSRLATVRNPLGILVANDLFDALSSFIPLLLFPSIVACIVAVVLRFRRAQGTERQQVKWFTYGTALSILMVVAIAIVVVFTTQTGNGTSWLFYLAVVFIPISAGIAILRYRLYDIDVLINLTLVYGLLTVTLLGTYLLLVFAGQHLLAGLLGPRNAVVLVASTLIVAGLFQPLRRRVQQLVDRRFYRSKYDATQVVTRFSETLRQEVDLDQICTQLLAAVQETVQPNQLSMWLRPQKPQERIEQPGPNRSSA
jgi:hypothetical protein